MKFATIILTALLPVVLAKDHGGNDKAADAGKNVTSIKAQCHEVAKLTELTELAANQTKLDKVTKGNATKAAEIKSKASTAATALSTLHANATLMTTCNQISAEQKMTEQCGEVASLEHLNKLVANQTALDKATKGNATRADALKAKASDDAPKLATLSSNTTLTQFCSVEQIKGECKAMSGLQKQVAEANNQTFLEAHFKGNAAMIAEFKNHTAKAQAKLTTMQGNATLVSTCAALKAASVASVASTDSKGTNSVTKASAAGGFSPDATMVSVAVLFAAVMFAL